MERKYRRIKSGTSIPKTSLSGKKMDFKVRFRQPKLQLLQTESTTTRPKTAMSKRIITLKTHQKTQSNRSSIEDLDYDLINKAFKTQKIEEVYFSKKLALEENSFIFDEDAFKLQKLITGGYCCQDEFMSLSKFNQAKDNFVLLKQIYQKAKKHQESKKLQKKPIKSRNIFSVIYLNQNLKMMGHNDTKDIFQKLKIVR